MSSRKTKKKQIQIKTCLLLILLLVSSLITLIVVGMFFQK